MTQDKTIDDDEVPQTRKMSTLAGVSIGIGITFIVLGIKLSSLRTLNSGVKSKSED